MKGVGVGVIVIKFSVHNQRLRRITSGIIPSNAYGKLKFEFDFRTDDWDSVEIKTANFYYNGKNKPVDLDENNQCFVPKEVIYTPSFSVSVHGGDIVTNNVKNLVEEATLNSPTIPDENLGSDDINILDGGEIILDLTDTPTEDDDTDLPNSDSVVGYIINNNIPFYSGIAGETPSMIEYKQLDVLTSNYTDQGFYTTINSDGQITEAGYQITFVANTDNAPQTFSIYSEAKIVAAYQYHPAFNQWMDVGFDGTYWVENGTMTKNINGQQIIYTTYEYNVELMGDVIVSPEYWRFEVEVL